MGDAYTEIVKSDFYAYNYHVHNENCKVGEERWKPTKFHKDLCHRVQKFIETPTGHAYDVLLVETPPQHGKGFWIRTLVLTTRGWVEHGSLKVGDYVFSPTGEPVMVLAVQEPYDWHCKEIQFDTGERFICSYEHEWVIEDGTVIEAQNIKRNLEINLTQAIEGQGKLALNPRLLGSLIAYEARSPKSKSRIPPECMVADDRIELLRVITSGRGYYTTRNKQLCYDVFTLANSLGVKCKVTKPDDKYTVTLDKESKTVKIKSVKSVKNEMTNCITVDGGVYLVGKGLVPTHNSMTITETLPSWWLGHNPEGKAIVGCYNSEYSKKFGQSNRSNVKNYGFLFNEELSPESKSIEEFKLSNGLGKFICRGLLAGITGNGGNLIIIDDPVKNGTEAMSKNTRDKVWTEYVRTVKTRTSDGAKIIVIMTPWHEDDLAGRIIKTEKNLTLLKYPCECESDDDLLKRAKGDALCPEIGKDNEWLVEFKDSFLNGDNIIEGNTGRQAWYSMFQCRPVSEKGNLLKREWWKWYTTLPKMDKVIMSVDCAFKAAEKNDYVAIEVIGKAGGNYYLIDLIKDHLTFKQTCDAILGVKSRHPEIREVLIEDKANGPAVQDVLKGMITGIIMVTPMGGKEARVNAVSYAVEAGNCYLPQTGWSRDFVEECASFPNALHDDCVDAFTQGMARLLFSFKRRGVQEPTNLLFPVARKRKRREKIIVI